VEDGLKAITRRLYTADKMWRDDGNSARTFILLHTGAGPRLDHPCWDASWAMPDEHMIDDLEELGILRVEAHLPNNKQRTFTFTHKGREEAKALVDQINIPTGIGGHVPTPDRVVDWLIRVRADAPDCFSPPTGLLDRAVTDGLIGVPARERFAGQLIRLVEDGYLRGEVPDFDQALDEQRLQMTTSLELSMEALERPASSTTTHITVHGPMINSQIAAGDISSFSVFVQLLDRAYDEISALSGIDGETREGAKGLLDRLRGKVASGAGIVVTSASATLVSEVLARLAGLPLH
jgi:hypothetical protein